MHVSIFVSCKDKTKTGSKFLRIINVKHGSTNKHVHGIIRAGLQIFLQRDFICTGDFAPADSSLNDTVDTVDILQIDVDGARHDCTKVLPNDDNVFTASKLFVLC